MTTTEPTPRPTGDHPGDGSPAGATDDPDAADSGVRTAARGSALNVAGALIAAVVSFATVGLITNAYGRTGAGLFFAATAIFTLVANGTRLGGESSLTLFVARFRASGEHGALLPLVNTAMVATVTTSVVIGAAGFVAAPWIAEVLTAESSNATDLTIMIRILAVAVPWFALSQVLFGASRGFGTMRPSVLAGQVFRPIAQLALVAVVIVASAETWPLAAAWAAASVGTAAWIATWTWRRLQQGQRPATSRPATTFSATDYWRFSGPRAVTDLVSSALERLDVLLVATLLSAADAGLYGASNRLILAGQLLMMATAQSMAPLLSASFAQRRHADAKVLVGTITSWSVLLLWPLLITLAFGAEPVLAMFGDGFADAADVVRVLAIALAVIVAVGPGDILLLMTGDSVASLINHVAALAVLIVVSLLLLPQIGVIGAAWAWAASRLVLRVSAVARVWRTTTVHAFGRAAAMAALAAAIGFVPTGLVIHQLVEAGLVALGLHIITGGLLYLAAVFLVRRDLELEQLLGVLSRRSRMASGANP